MTGITSFAQFGAFSAIFIAILLLSGRIAFDITKGEGRYGRRDSNSGLFYTIFMLQAAAGAVVLWVFPSPIAYSAVGGILTVCAVVIILARMLFDLWDEPFFFYLIAILFAALAGGLIFLVK